MTFVNRRSVLLAAAGLPLVAGCSTPLPLSAPPPPADPAAMARLRQSAEAHGLAAYRSIADINVSYGGQWRPLIDRVQPVLVDPMFRGSSQERLLPAEGLTAQAYRGAAGRKQVVWRRGASASESQVAVWFNGTPSSDARVLDAAALVAEGYAMFLLGPLWALERTANARLEGTELVNGRLCDVVQAWVRPGLGRVAMDRVAFFIDREDATTRRMRFTLEGFADTAGAVAEVDTFEHQRRFGVLWPMRSHEEVLHPIRLPAHDWHVTGLDVNRGYAASALTGAEFTGAAAAPAAAL
jgi:hypothetical protein